MTNLSVFKRDDLEIIINTATGESFCSVAAYIRMSGKAKSTISERLKGVREIEIKTVEIPTLGGVQGVRLITEKIFNDCAGYTKIAIACGN